MSRLDEIKSNSRNVVNGSSVALSETWEFRRLTSDFGTDPRTYTDWDEMQALPTRDTHSQQYDDLRQAHFRMGVQFLRCTDDSPSPQLKQGDQVRKDENSPVFAVSGVSSSGPGTIQYALTREEFLYADGQRGGGA